MMRGRRGLAAIIWLAAIAGALAYLRDPPWLLTMTSGLHEWQTDSAGVRYRWMGGHASFFVPAGAAGVTIPLRATFDAPDDWPVEATIAIDDRPADRIVLTDNQWRSATLRLPPRGRRRTRRIDIRVDRTRHDNRGLQVGEIRAQSP
jgi:hypothetical protein